MAQVCFEINAAFLGEDEMNRIIKWQQARRVTVETDGTHTQNTIICVFTNDPEVKYALASLASNTKRREQASANADARPVPQQNNTSIFSKYVSADVLDAAQMDLQAEGVTVNTAQGTITYPAKKAAVVERIIERAIADIESDARLEEETERHKLRVRAAEIDSYCQQLLAQLPNASPDEWAAMGAARDRALQQSNVHDGKRICQRQLDALQDERVTAAERARSADNAHIRLECQKMLEDAGIQAISQFLRKQVESATSTAQCQGIVAAAKAEQAAISARERCMAMLEQDLGGNFEAPPVWEQVQSMTVAEEIDRFCQDGRAANALNAARTACNMELASAARVAGRPTDPPTIDLGASIPEMREACDAQLDLLLQQFKAACTEYLVSLDVPTDDGGFDDLRRQTTLQGAVQTCSRILQDYKDQTLFTLAQSEFEMTPAQRRALEAEERAAEIARMDAYDELALRKDDYEERFRWGAEPARSGGTTLFQERVQAAIRQPSESEFRLLALEALKRDDVDTFQAIVDAVSGIPAMKRLSRELTALKRSKLLSKATEQVANAVTSWRHNLVNLISGRT